MLAKRREERGAAAVILAVMISLLVVFAAFAVDLGVQRVARRDMQALADVIALDMARQLDGRTQAVIKATSEWRGGLEDSLSYNLNGYGGSTPSIQTQQQQADAIATVAGTPLVVMVRMGILDETTGVFTDTLPYPDVPNAVRVTTSTSVDFSFTPGSGGVTRTAVANTDSVACFRLGSYAARIDTSNSVVLKGLVESALGGSVNVAAADYRGLALADVDLLGLATELGLGGVDELAGANVTAGALFLAAASVLRQDGDTANAAILENIATRVGALPTIALARLLDVSSGGGAAATATINALDLVAGTAFVADGTGLSIPSLATNLGLSGTALTSTVNITQSLQFDCGAVDEAVASTSQVHVAVAGTLASVPALPTSLLGVTASAAAGSTQIGVDLASATGTLKKIVCGAATAASPEGVDVSVFSQLATVSSLNQQLTLSGTLGSGVLGGLLGGLLGSVASVQVSGSVSLSMSNTQPTETDLAVIRIPNSPTSYSLPTATGTGSLGLSSLSVVPVATLTLTAKNILGLNVTLSASQISTLTTQLLSGLVSNVYSPLISRIESSLVTPLSALLGVKLAGADVFGVPRPQCTVPALRG